MAGEKRERRKGRDIIESKGEENIGGYIVWQGKREKEGKEEIK